MKLPILAHAGYASGVAYYDCATNGQLERTLLEASVVTLRFDTTNRYCVGWHDLDSGKSYACPTANSIDRAYTQCPACQKRTGFNPAFYYASSISDQQQKRNQEPHMLYLARFAPGVLKVGISHARRGNSRLLEQGASAAMILDTYPTALIARQYEAAIARQPGIVEHLSTKQKRCYYSSPFDPAEAKRELKAAVKQLEQQLSMSFGEKNLHLLWPDFFFGQPPDLSLVQFVDKQQVISGNVIGCIGTDLVVGNGERIVCLNLKSFYGYQVSITDTLEDLELAPVQPSLF